MSTLLSPLDTLAHRLGIEPTSETLVLALTHSSYAAEHATESNERLEFLGDAVVDLAIADLILREHPELNEGASSVLRSRVVNEESLATAATALDLAAYLRIGRGVIKENGLQRPSILADAFEALVAAIYLERGYDVAKHFVQHALANAVANASSATSTLDAKTRLRQWSEAAGLGAPVYETVASGPSHDTVFEATVRVGELSASGTGRSKKRAETRAAEAAWEGRRHAGTT
ncbi:MAG: ribonuclease III [Acidimicrobiales bacterium]